MPLGVEQGLGGDLALDPLAKDVDRDLGALSDRRRQVRVGDRTPDGIAVAAAGHAAYDLAAGADRLVAERDRARVAERERPQPALRGAQRIRSDERLVAPHAELETRLERGVVGSDVGTPHAVALLQTQRVDRPVAARAQAMRLSGLVERPPEAGPVLRRAVELPAELADERHPERADRDVAERDLPQPHVAEIERVGRERGENVAGTRTPQAEAGPACGDVGDRDRAVLGKVPAYPARVVIAERGSGDDRETVLGEPRDREVAFDAAAAVEHLGIGDLADVAGDAVVAEALEQLGGPRAGDLEL